MKLVIALGAAIIALTGRCVAQTTWELVNEYPPTSLAGEADIFFADAVKRRTDSVVIRPLADAKSGLRTRDQLQAVTAGRFAMANSFAGALDDESPAFLIPTLPFLAATTDDARALFAAARPLYEKLFADRRQKLLFVSPWPASGIWSASAITGVEALRARKIRTYDKTGTDVFLQVAATAGIVSFADLDARLKSGEIDAVLSSGDGGAGRQLWRYLPHYSDIFYAVPLSFGSVSLDAWGKLDPATRSAIEDAAQETTRRQWAAMSDRVGANFVRMRESGVTIDEHPPADVMAALHHAAAKPIADWQGRAGGEATAAVSAFLARVSKR